MRKLLFATFCVGLLVLSATAAEACPEMEGVKEALLREQWGQVIRLCADEISLRSSPVLRAIRGHALLALNRNNESLDLFLSMTEEVHRVRWEEWTASFGEQNASSAVVLYLKGDSLARRGDWRRGITVYGQAVDRAKTPLMKAMILNARGVAHASVEEFEKATDDLETAGRMMPTFADAHASLGVVLLRKEAAEGALGAFEQALEHSQDSSLALIGRACARYGHMDPANVAKSFEDFDLAARNPAVRDLVDSNVLSILQEIREPTGDEVASKPGGMTLKGLFYMDPGARERYLSGLSPGELRGLLGKAHQNARHSDKAAAAFDAIPKVRLDLKGGLVGLTPDLFGGLARTSRADAGRWKEIHGQIAGNLLSKGEKLSPGGARTEDLEREYRDTGGWPVRTWFGLAQEVGARRR